MWEWDNANREFGKKAGEKEKAGQGTGTVKINQISDSRRVANASFRWAGTLTMRPPRPETQHPNTGYLLGMCMMLIGKSQTGPEKASASAVRRPGKQNAMYGWQGGRRGEQRLAYPWLALTRATWNQQHANGLLVLPVLQVSVSWP
jgi:hypothetical protein